MEVSVAPGLNPVTGEQVRDVVHVPPLYFLLYWMNGRHI